MLNSDTKRSRREVSERLRDAVDTGIFLREETRIYLSLADDEAHKQTYLM